MDASIGDLEMKDLHLIGKLHHERRRRMATKREVLEAALRGEGCLGKAADDEPVFVLRAQDALAGPTIRYWMHQVLMSTNMRGSPKIEQTNDVFEEFASWAAKHGTKIPD
jgi:hypothetical protein